MILANKKVFEIIDNALEEDVGRGDITSQAIVGDEEITAEIIAKEPGVVVGVGLAQLIFKRFDTKLAFKKKIVDGSHLEAGALIAQVVGPALSVLSAERVVLNFMQRLSGVATKVREYSRLVKDYQAEIYDTRKTTPSLRILEKYAVRMGGGRNHRFGLDDAILIKDNHIKVAGGINKAVALLKEQYPNYKKIEVEVEDLEGVKKALTAKADIIMLDNMEAKLMKQAVELIAGRAVVEASGNITKANLVEVAKTGVDSISLGELTHSIKALDISLNLCD